MKTLTLSLTLFLLIACSGEERSVETPAPASVPAPAPAAAPAPSAADAEKLVADLYADHDAGRSPFFQAESRERIDRYFEPSLAELIWKDAVAAQGEAGAIGFDPLYDAQDAEIKNLAIGSDGGGATVLVTFENFGAKQQIRYTLTPAAGGWKIADITYADGRTLRGAFAV